MDNSTRFKDGIIDDRDLFNLLQIKIKPENMPTLVNNKDELRKELEKKSYTEEQIQGE